MHKIMALDIGTKRIGIALSDYLQVIATPHSFIDRNPENKAIEIICDLAKENRVEKIVYSVGAALITVLYWRFGKSPNLGSLTAVLLIGILSSAFKGYYIPKCSREKK